jgi:hypothetical protein
MPRGLAVRVDASGTPVAVTRTDRRHAAETRVEQIDETWRIAEAWWREAPQVRTYYRVILEGGRPLTLFREEATGTWSEQSYSASNHEARA